MERCICALYLVRNGKGTKKANTLYNNRFAIRNFCKINPCPIDGIIDDKDTERIGVYIIPDVLVPKKCWEGMH